MPFVKHERYSVRYEVAGPDKGITYVLVNGLTQYAELWAIYARLLSHRGIRVVTFDLLGQGSSDKPALFINQADLVAMTDTIINETARGDVFLAGISFGGLVALRYAIEHTDRLTGLVAMSTFAELSPQLQLIGNALRNALVLGGISYLQDWLLPMNVSDEWLRPRMETLDAVKRPGWLMNDLYALQNLMESFLDFTPLTAQLNRIKVPTMILNAEHDFLTPRSLHEQLRVNIPDSALFIVPNAYHAFTLEKPELTASLLADFAQQVLSGMWQGKQSVWIAPDTPGEMAAPFPRNFDHLRSIPVVINSDDRNAAC